MTEEDARSEYEQLSRSLEQNGLGWIRTQVDEYSRLGKPQQREVAVSAERAEQQQTLFGGPAPRQRRGPKASFLATVEYTPQERLRILAEAISRGVPELLEMAKRIPGLLRTDLNAEAPHVVLVRESDSGELEEKILQSDVPEDVLVKLQKLLHEAAEEAVE